MFLLLHALFIQFFLKGIMEGNGKSWMHDMQLQHLHMQKILILPGLKNSYAKRKHHPDKYSFSYTTSKGKKEAFFCADLVLRQLFVWGDDIQGSLAVHAPCPHTGSNADPLALVPPLWCPHLSHFPSFLFWQKNFKKKKNHVTTRRYGKHARFSTSQIKTTLTENIYLKFDSWN